MKICVVGGGVIGASIAYHLGRNGAQVVVIDSGAPAASNASFGWINASFFADAHHHALRARSIAAFGRIKAEVPDLPVNICGALWWEEQGAALAKMQDSLAVLGYPVERLDHAEALSLEPDLKGLPADVLQFPSEGAADVTALADTLLRASGAQVLRGVSVGGVLETNGTVTGVRSSLGDIMADRVVIAAGNGAPHILAGVGVKLPMLHRPGVLVTTKPVAAKIKSILVTRNGEVRQLADGRLLASAVANHQGDDSETTDTAQQISDRVLGWLGPLVGEDVRLDTLSLAHRPVPQDGLPVIGAAGPQGLHVAVMHSGVTLAAITGEATAAQIMGEQGFDNLLAPYSPTRFQ